MASWLHLGGCAQFGPQAQRWVRQRPLFMAVTIGTNMIGFALGGVSPARLALLCCVSSIPLGMAVIGAIRPRPDRMSPSGIWIWLASGSACIATAIALTGGLRSPLLPNLLGPVIATVALWRWTRPSHLLVGTFSLFVLLLFALPRSVTGPALPSPYFDVLISLNLLYGVRFGCRTVMGLSEGFSSKNRTLASVREGALQAATRRVRALEQVGGKLAHELKNPLAAIKSLLQLEASAARDERSQKRFEVMTREVARMESILRDYLTFARPLEDLKAASVDLATVADNVVALLEGRAEAAGVKMERTGDSVVLSADGRRLEEAVLNLAANALEATPSGGQVILEVDRHAERAVLRVRDTGKGMSAAVLEKIGTPFFTTRAEGNGLGVVLARAVVTQHGGRLDFQSRDGAGTCATITLPPAPLPAAEGATDGASAHR
jgi:signal transduction histidine kinase